MFWKSFKTAGDNGVLGASARNLTVSFVWQANCRASGNCLRRFWPCWRKSRRAGRPVWGAWSGGEYDRPLEHAVYEQDCGASKNHQHGGRDEDLRRLTPLGFKHIRFLGRHDFTFRGRPEPGGLRPLRQIQVV